MSVLGSGPFTWKPTEVSLFEAALPEELVLAVAAAAGVAPPSNLKADVCELGRGFIRKLLRSI
jgi:hypothetical protein